MGGRTLTGFRSVLLGMALCGSLDIHAFNFDTKTDLIWQHSPIGQSGVWFMNGTNFSGAVGWFTNDIENVWRLVAAGDLNRDGQTDLFWRRADTGQNQIWLMRGTNRVARQEIARGGIDFAAVGIGDVNADGHADILWRRSVDQYVGAWLMNGTNWTGAVQHIPSPDGGDWTPAAVVDWNSDGYSDVIYRNEPSGGSLVLLLEGTNRLGQIKIHSEPDWKIIGAGQFNSVANPDLLWRDVNGQYRISLMNGADRSAVVPLPRVNDTNWTFVGTGGYASPRLLSAAVNQTPAQLILQWNVGSDPAVRIERRLFGSEAWTNLVREYLPPRFTNSGLAVGSRYEFKVNDSYVLAGLNATPVEERGTVLLVVERSLLRPLREELERFKLDLVGDGWTVVQTNVPRHDDRRWSANTASIAAIKSFVKETHSDRPNAKVVLLIGHAPIPYSGFQNPDGHGARALPADLYYGDVDGIYTDGGVHSMTRDRIESGEERHDNMRADGRFDEKRIAPNSDGVAQLELAVGRIDFSNLPALSPLSETDLLRRYFDKNHRFRHKKLTFAQRTVAGSFFHPYGTNPAIDEQAVRNSTRWFAQRPGHVVYGDPLRAGCDALWGLYAAWGWPHGIQGMDWRYHAVEDFTRRENHPKLGFCGLYGSYFVDIDCKNNLLRGFLGLPDAGLGAFWFQPHAPGGLPLAFEQLGLGETLGSAFLRSINENSDRTAANLHLAYLGDPTLRLQTVAPPADLKASGVNQAVLSWRASPEPHASYWVYRSANGSDGPWKRLTKQPLRETRFTDAASPNGSIYQVRALALAVTGSGSFTNLSQGAFTMVSRR